MTHWICSLAQQRKRLSVCYSFLSGTDSYGKLDSEVMNASENEIAEMMSLLRGSFVRTLSSELYRHGYACSATLLRRVLAEDSISRSQSKYYTYAASDMKKH